MRTSLDSNVVLATAFIVLVDQLSDPQSSQCVRYSLWTFTTFDVAL